MMNKSITFLKKKTLNDFLKKLRNMQVLHGVLFFAAWTTSNPAPAES